MALDKMAHMGQIGQIGTPNPNPDPNPNPNYP